MTLKIFSIAFNSLSLMFIACQIQLSERGLEN